jgi:hypothetical protein
MCMLVGVAVVMADSVATLRHSHGTAFNAMEWLFTAVFTLEYIARLLCVRHPARYATSFFGVIDLLALLPTYLALFFPELSALIDVRVLRLLRVFRIFKLTAYVLEYQGLAMALAARRVHPDREPQWRLFQLAFLLLNVASAGDPAHADREVVELLFFPTGGGKTEAYLGIAAYVMVLRRLRGRTRPDEGAGVAVLLRYTLRLLTLDQLGRAATLICALEVLRRQRPKRLGTRRLSVGLWVGRSGTDNRMADAEKRLRAVGEAFKKAQAGVQFADAWHELARALMDQDKFTDALSALGETLEVRRVARDRFGLVRLHDDLGRAAKGQGDALRAAQEFARGRCVAERLNLAHRLGAFDAELDLLREAIDALPETSLASVLAAAQSEHDALEAQWAAPPEPPAPPAAEST